MNRWLPVLLAILLFPAASLAHSEKEHAELLCAGFDAIEWRNEDGTRTDCLNAQYAVEVDYTYKWAEGVGQALYYAELHQRTPGIIFDQASSSFATRKPLRSFARNTSNAR